jgi:hypothetical protein
MSAIKSLEFFLLYPVNKREIPIFQKKIIASSKWYLKQ